MRMSLMDGGQAIAPRVHHGIHAQGHPSHGLLLASF